MTILELGIAGAVAALALINAVAMRAYRLSMGRKRAEIAAHQPSPEQVAAHLATVEARQAAETWS